MESTNVFPKRLKEALYNAEMKPTDLANKSGISKATISNYMTGKYEPRQENLVILADALNVDPAWLAGYASKSSDDDAPSRTAANKNGRPTRRSLPVLGKIACGEPIYDDGNVEFYFDPQNPVDADFCLIAEGDSMIGVHIQEGDIVFIRKQPMVENGQIAAVRIGDEFTLKRFYWDKLRSVVQLNAENPNYPPIIKTGAEIDEISVIGLAVGFQHSLIPGKKIAPSEGVTPTGREQ